MGEWQWVEAPDRAAARRALRHALGDLDPQIQVLAEGFLAAETEIDLLGLGSEGELLSIRISLPGEAEASLTRSLSDLAWLRTRRSDFKKLSPGIGLDVSAPPRAFVFATEFGMESASATQALPVGVLQLIRCRFFRQQGRLGAMLDLPDPRAPQRPNDAPLAASAAADEPELEPLQRPLTPRTPQTSLTPPTPRTPRTPPARPPAAAPMAASAADPATAPLEDATQADPPSEFTLRTGFRTGLSEADLRLDRG